MTAENKLCAWDRFRALVGGMRREETAVRITADFARELMAEHEQDCDRMERAAEAIERLTTAKASPAPQTSNEKLVFSLGDGIRKLTAEHYWEWVHIAIEDGVKPSYEWYYLDRKEAAKLRGLLGHYLGVPAPETTGELERLRRLEQVALALDDAVAEFGPRPEFISEAFQRFSDALHDVRPTEKANELCEDEETETDRQCRQMELDALNEQDDQWTADHASEKTSVQRSVTDSIDIEPSLSAVRWKCDCGAENDISQDRCRVGGCSGARLDYSRPAVGVHKPSCASYRILPRGECDCGAVPREARRCLAMTDEFATKVCALPESHGGPHEWVLP